MQAIKVDLSVGKVATVARTHRIGKGPGGVSGNDGRHSPAVVGVPHGNQPFIQNIDQSAGGVTEVGGGTYPHG